LLTIHDNGKIGVSLEHKSLFGGLAYKEELSYFCIGNPSPKEKEIIMDRLFDFQR
jgi:hypothetical protein